MERSRLAPLAVLALLALAAAGCGSASRPFPAEPTPKLVSDSLRFSVLEPSQWHTCGTTLDGSTWCWGQNEYGELGTSAPLDLCDISGIALLACTHIPQRVVAAPPLTALAISLERTCGLTAAGEAWCWGFGLGGQLGDGRSTTSVEPVAVAGGHGFGLMRSSTSSMATCAIDLAGEGWCWGVNLDGVFGNGNTLSSPAPLRVDWGQPFTALDLGEMHGCGVASDGQAWCWGSNWYGQLGAGSAGGFGGLSRSFSPIPVVGGQVFQSIAAGADHTCALDPAGAAWCWGHSVALGSLTAESDYGTPQPVAGGHAFVQIASGQLHTCGLTASGEVWCWGQNYLGELGDGSQNPAQTPVRLNASARFARLAHRATCALTADGQAWCWGDNSVGQVGQRSVYAR